MAELAEVLNNNMGPILCSITICFLIFAGVTAGVLTSDYGLCSVIKEHLRNKREVLNMQHEEKMALHRERIEELKQKEW